MNKKTIRVIISLLVIILLIPCLGFAQDKEKENTPYWYNSYCKINYTKVDSLIKLEKEYGILVAAEAKKQGKILEHHTLIHHTGDEYNVVFMTKYPSWCVMEKGWFNAVFKEIEPNKDKRDAYNDAYDWVFEGSPHYDGIYTEVTK